MGLEGKSFKLHSGGVDGLGLVMTFHVGRCQFSQ